MSKQHQRQCGNCSHWMTNQCPFERAGNKQTMDGLPCKDFDWKHHIRAAMVAPNVPAVRTASSPMVVWDGYSLNETTGLERWFGTYFDGQKIEISSRWYGGGWAGVVVSTYGAVHRMKRYCYPNIEEAKEAVEDHLREMATDDLHKHWAAMAQAMYALGLDHPISVYQRDPKRSYIRPAAPCKELEGVDQ